MPRLEWFSCEPLQLTRKTRSGFRCPREASAFSSERHQACDNRTCHDCTCDLGGTAIGAQLRRPERKQSCRFRFSISLLLNQTPAAIKIPAISSVIRFIVMRWR